MLGISRIYHQLVGNVIHGARGLVPYNSSSVGAAAAAASSGSTTLSMSNMNQSAEDDNNNITTVPGGSRCSSIKREQEALTMVFGMDECGRIQKKKASQIMSSLGLISPADHHDHDDGEDDDDHVTVTEEEQQQQTETETEKGKEENDKRKKEEVVREAFSVFDVDGDGYIDAKELKRVLVCLGLDNGWDLSQVELMIKSADLNLDGKIDFHEFQLMMGY